MAALTARLAAAAIVAGCVTVAHAQTYPGPSQRIEPMQPMQSMQPMQPMAPLPAPPMSAPGDTPGTTSAPQAGSSGGSPPASAPPVSSSEREQQPAPADTPSPR